MKRMSKWKYLHIIFVLFYCHKIIRGYHFTHVTCITFPTRSLIIKHLKSKTDGKKIKSFKNKKCVGLFHEFEMGETYLYYGITKEDIL